MPAVDTHFSTVLPCECDELHHLNIQFYFSRLEEAERQFRLIAGLTDTLVGQRRVRHVRFHREAVTGAVIKVRSALAFDGPHMLSVVHELLDVASGAVLASAVDGYDPSGSAIKTLRGRFKDYLIDMPDAAQPRGLPHSPPQTRLDRSGLKRTGTASCYRGTLLPRDMNAESRADDQYLVACFSQANPHLWETTPLTAAHLQEQSQGRGVLEMKLSWVSPLKLGDMVIVESGLTQVQDKTFQIRHHMFESRTDRLIAVCDAVVGALDLSERTLVPLTETTRRQISGQLIN